MKRRSFLMNSTILSLGALASNNNQDYLKLFNSSDAPSIDDLYARFIAPRSDAKPFVRWWWNGDLIEKSEIIRQLDVLKEAGIGGVEINPIEFPGTDTLGIEPLNWLSEEWIDMVLFAVEEAKKRDISCDLIVGSGWPFGGEFLAEEEQGQVLVMNVDDYRLSNYRIVGPAKVSISRNELINSIKGYDRGRKELFSVRMIPSDMDEYDGGVELIDQFDGDFLTIDVPYYGEQNLCVVVKVIGQQTVTRGAPGASGPVLNHFNKSAVLKYLNKISDAFKRRSKGIGDIFRAMFCDSLELDGNTWCEDFYEEFEKRRGYSLKPFLPFVLSYSGKEPFVTSYLGAEGAPMGPKLSRSALVKVERVRYDYTITKQELFEERFYNTLLNWCKDNNVRSRVQPYGIGYHPLEASLKVDIPECETWLGDHIGLRNHPGYTTANKFVSSAAKLAGKKIVSCEEITDISLVFYATLEAIKITGDQSNISGVNHSVLHGYNYNPVRAEFPGWVQFGSYFNERNTWWPFFKKWTNYKARLSTVFQIAEPESEVALFLPLADKWSRYGQQFQPAFGWGARYPWYEYELWTAIHQNGSACDYVSDNILADSEVVNGKLKYNDSIFTTLILMEVDSISLNSYQTIKKLAEQGGRIIFIKNLPSKTIGLNHSLENSDEIKSEFEDLVNHFPENCKIVSPPQKDLLKWFRQLQTQLGMIPSVIIDKPHRDINQIHYTYKDKEIFFFTNSNNNESFTLNFNFNVAPNLNPWIWNPETGERFRLHYDDEKNRLTLHFKPAESKLIVFDTEKKGNLLKDVLSKKKDEQFNLENNWNVSLKHIDGSVRTIEGIRLEDLFKIEGVNHFAGVITYSQEFNLKSASSFELLNLGKVNEGISEVIINGKSVGSVWYGKHLLNTGKTLKNGKNTIEIKITTILGNYCKSLKDNDTCQKWTKNLPFVPVGMIGPVELY